MLMQREELFMPQNLHTAMSYECCWTAVPLMTLMH